MNWEMFFFSGAVGGTFTVLIDKRMRRDAVSYIVPLVFAGVGLWLHMRG